MVWALCLVGSLTASSTNAQDITSLVAGQVYSTTNLVNSSTSATNTTGTWQNIGLWNQGLPCWQPSDVWTKGAYCGPQPYFNNGSFNFSYGQTDVYQTVNISTAVPAGTGIQVNGFTFGFTAKNGNGWDNGQLDYLKAYVNVYDSKNKVVEAYDYSNWTNKQYNWTVFPDPGNPAQMMKFSPTFNKPYAVSGLSSVTYGFVGRDTNGWAGPYGPEIYNVNFSLKYSVDPCVANPLSSSSCPGFKDAMAKLNPQTTTNYSITSATTAITTPTAMADPTKNEVTNSNVGGVQITTTGEITPIVNVPKFVRGANDLGEVIKEKEKPKLTVRPVVIPTPTVVARRAETKVDAIAKVTEMQQAVVTERVDVVSVTKSPVQEFIQQQTRVATAPVIINRRIISEYTDADQDKGNDAFGGAKSGSQFSLMLGKGQGLQVNEIQPPQRQSMMSATNPLNSYLTMVPSENQPDSKSTVRSNVQNNELAGGVDLTKMAIQPVGFNDYLNLALTDAAFYGPKEVYQNQRVVDNARAQRLLQGASDRLHQEMVDGQYKLGQ